MNFLNQNRVVVFDGHITEYFKFDFFFFFMQESNFLEHVEVTSPPSWYT